MIFFILTLILFVYMSSSINQKIIYVEMGERERDFTKLNKQPDIWIPVYPVVLCIDASNVNIYNP